MILPFVDGGIVEIDSDAEYESGSCSTCDYGSVYVNEYTFKLTTGNIYLEARDDYYPLSEAYMMKLLLSNVEEIKNMSEKEFYEWLGNHLDTDIGKAITRYEWKEIN